MLIKKCPATEKPLKTQWFVSMIHHPQCQKHVSGTHHGFNMNLSSVNTKSLIHSCLPSWRAQIIKCTLSHRHFPAVWSQHSSTSPLIPKQMELYESFSQPPSFSNSQGGENCHPFYSKPWHTHHFQTRMVPPSTVCIHECKYAKISIVCIIYPRFKDLYLTRGKHIGTSFGDI